MLFSLFHLTAFLFAYHAPAMGADVAHPKVDVTALCREQLPKIAGGPYDKTMLDPACADVKVMDGCTSANGTPIFHFDRPGQGGPGANRRNDRHLC